MDDIKLLKFSMIFFLPLIFFLIFFIVLLSNQSASGEESVVVVAKDGFNIPFESTTKFIITSNFGTRIDPINGTSSFHSGLDLATSCGTKILASNNGTIFNTGYSANGLGNYVYIKHQTEQGTIYTAYGHMLDNSIVVEKGQNVVTGQVIGLVGTTGRSTGCHLHFMMMNKKVSFNKKDLIDPTFVVKRLK